MSALARFVSLKMYPNSRDIDRFMLLMWLALVLSVRFYKIGASPIWYDEAFGIRLAQHAPDQILAIASRDNHPPLYYFVLHYWMQWFGDSPVAVRSLGALADTAALLFCLKLLSLVATPGAIRIAALLLALLPISVSTSQEARMYPLLGLWLMAATVALVGWNQMPERKRYPLMYVLLMSFAFYTHYFAALCVLTHWLFWWQARARRATDISLRDWFVVNAAIVVFFLPWMPFLFEQIAHKPDFGWIPPLERESVLTLIWQMLVGSPGTNGFSLWQLWPTIVVTICAVQVVLKDRSEARYSCLLVGYFFVPAITLLLLAAFKPAFVIRYFYFAAMGIPLIVAVALDTGWQRSRILVSTVLLAAVIGEIQGLTAMSLRPATGRLDVLVAELQAQSHPGDEILVDDMFWYLPLLYYFEGRATPGIYVGRYATKTLGYPDNGAWALMSPLLQSSAVDDAMLSSLGTKRVWWITLNSVVEDISFLSSRWKRARTLDGGPIEARLYIRE
ncbi:MULTISPECIES: glycosyltransferase family 39 protein [unclassified Pseudomonas]|uniref:glycosyltransferase family 39 protein n=1 Tax=unclassified Pseudomonas TaxID=196821 RepID=UPI000A1E3E3B|nr:MULTISPECIES: glycosyltransferase family 39 protein [unclassified Pseudomonas]MDI2141052.1 glycosyltransferase family 39 protein [Pseudomonas sp. ITA]